jgi:hypothetical protein
MRAGLKLCDLTVLGYLEVTQLWGWGVTAAQALAVALVVVPILRWVKRRRARAAAAAPPLEGKLTRGENWVKFERRRPRWAR